MWALALLMMSAVQAAEMWSLKGMTCQSCADILKAEVALYPPLEAAYVSAIDKQACFEDSELFTEHRQALLDGLAQKNLPIHEITKVERCPEPITSFWSEAFAEELNVKLISTHERFSMRKARVKGSYTLFDFGALWCAPCLEGSKILTQLLRRRQDVVVQAIEIEGPYLRAFETPVAFQYLSNAEGLPHFVLYGPDRKKLYAGSSLDQVLLLLDEDPAVLRKESQLTTKQKEAPVNCASPEKN